jgi:hypothetical protein
MTGNINSISDDAMLGGQRNMNPSQTEDGVTPKRSRYARTPSEYAVHIMIEGGHREEVRFPTIQDFQKWYSSELVPKSSSDDFISVPIKNIQGEYMVVRPSRVIALRVEPIFASSVERF